MDSEMFVRAFAGFFAIMNPFVALPMFLSLTDGATTSAQRRTALRVVLYSAILGGTIMLTGSSILSFFGIGIDDFRMAGGIVLLMIGLGMLNGTGASAHTGTPSEQAHQAEQDDVSFYPMTFPMIVGPGTITTIVVLTGHADGPAGYLGVGAALAVVLITLGVVLFFAANIGHHLSQTLRVIMTRLMGMILAAIAVEMIVTGIQAAFPTGG